MPITYSLIQRPKPGDPAAPRNFYAIIQSSGEVKMRELAEQISAISTVSVIDTAAVLEGFVQVVPGLLLNGKIVRLGDFGSFMLTLASDGAPTEAEFNKNMIKRVRVKFRPGSLISTIMKTASYEKA